MSETTNIKELDDVENCLFGVGEALLEMCDCLFLFFKFLDRLRWDGANEGKSFNNRHLFKELYLQDERVKVLGLFGVKKTVALTLKCYEANPLREGAYADNCC